MVGCLFAYALLHAANPFFSTLFFWLIVGFGLNVLYFHIRLKRAQKGTFSDQPKDFKWARHTTPPPTAAPAFNPGNKLKAAFGIGLVIFFFIFTFVIVLSIFGSDSEDLDNMVTTIATTDARVRFEANDFRGAIQSLQKNIGEDQFETTHLVLMADCYYGLQKMDSALYWYSEAYADGQRDAYLSHMLGYLLDEQDRQSEAIPYYQEAVQLDSTKADVLLRLAEIDPAHAEEYKARVAQAKRGQ